MQAVAVENTALLAFLRVADTESVLVLHNLSGKISEVKLPAKLEVYNKIYFSNKKMSITKGVNIEMPAYSTLVLSREVVK
ncbi:alpha-glucosidase C-terminal domain-containing protein [Flavobacterium sp. 3HN19-14]|uniref:alpha-glucosidase C-terminal domain-containing protein n=1 Tax=Flavobacterium sp. 3HN19-14 TaxID=3448133 RepID=UPI003EE31135